MYSVSVRAQKGTETLTDKGTGNSVRTAYAAAQSLARSLSNDGYAVEVGRCQKVSAS